MFDSVSESLPSYIWTSQVTSLADDVSSNSTLVEGECIAGFDSINARQISLVGELGSIVKSTNNLPAF